MDEFVLSRNVARFKELLQKESNPSQRKLLEQLLAEEESRLAVLIKQRINSDAVPR